MNLTHEKIEELMFEKTKELSKKSYQKESSEFELGLLIPICEV